MQPTELVGIPEVVRVQDPGAVCRSTRARLRKRSTGSGDHSSSEWKYKTGMYCASSVERCAGVTLLSRGDAGSAAAAHATAANPSATSIPRHLVRDLDIDASVAGRALAPAECGRLRTYDCLSFILLIGWRQDRRQRGKGEAEDAAVRGRTEKEVGLGEYVADMRLDCFL